jgi:hypothetical protein
MRPAHVLLIGLAVLSLLAAPTVAQQFDAGSDATAQQSACSSAKHDFRVSPGPGATSAGAVGGTTGGAIGGA